MPDAADVSSGQAATTLAILNIAQSGDEIVSADNLYGGTYNLFLNVQLTNTARPAATHQRASNDCLVL